MVGLSAVGCEQQTQAAPVQVTASDTVETEVVSPTITPTVATAAEATASNVSADSSVPDGSPDPWDVVPAEVMSHTADYQRYKAINPDVIGWISVPNTRIEYPVLMAEDNDYYLTHNVERERSKSGSIFMDYRNADPSNQRHLVIYGHNMNNGTMFNTLNSYKKKDFFENNRKIYFYWGDGQPIEYEVYAAYNVGIDIDFIKVVFTSDEDFLGTMTLLQQMTRFEPTPPVTLEANDQIITLSTCTYEYDNQRFVVQARRVK